MALQSDAIENRLEEMKQDARRMMFDSHLRAFRGEVKTPAPSANRASKPVKRSEGEYPVNQIVALLEELSRRIDGLEKKDRAISDEVRQQARRDQRRRQVVLAVGVSGTAILCACRVLGWL